jgi:uncharacterized membrane protein
LSQFSWLKSESEYWVRDGVIDIDQRSLILGRYEGASAKAGSPLLILFSIIGALLIGSGIIMIFATNWWRIPLPIKLTIAFLPLLVAQSICVYTMLNRSQSSAFREGSATFLVVSFFATVALVGQSFHISNDLGEFMLLCGVFALPAAYLLRSKAALTIYMIIVVAGSQDWVDYWVQSLVLVAAALPLFYSELRLGKHKAVLSYIMFLLSAGICLMIVPFAYEIFDSHSLYIALSVGLALLLADASVQKISSVRFAPVARYLGIMCIAVTIAISAVFFDFEVHYEYSLLVIILLSCGYAAVRWFAKQRLSTTDIYAAAALLLALSGPIAGIAANALLFALGIASIVRGSRNYRISQMNLGMIFLILVIGFRFFDSDLSLLTRSIVFILLGIAFLIVNYVVSRRWKSVERSDVNTESSSDGEEASR